MKRTIITITTLVAVLLTGCNQNIKPYLGKALIVGNEIKAVEAEKCKAGDTDSCKTADRIAVWLDAGQKIYDTGSYADNCGLMLSVSEIAYDWVVSEYPDEIEYRVILALLKDELLNYCGEVKP